MSKVFIEEDSLTAIGNAIRSKTGDTAPLSVPTGMVEAIGSISGGGSSEAVLKVYNFAQSHPAYLIELTFPEDITFPCILSCACYASASPSKYETGLSLGAIIIDVDSSQSNNVSMQLLPNFQSTDKSNPWINSSLPSINSTSVAKFNYKGVEIPKEIDIRAGGSKYMNGYDGADVQCWLLYAINE